MKRCMGERIEYEMEEDRELEIDQEINVHLQMKDVFNGGESDEFLSNTAI